MMNNSKGEYIMTLKGGKFMMIENIVLKLLENTIQSTLINKKNINKILKNKESKS